MKTRISTKYLYLPVILLVLAGSLTKNSTLVLEAEPTGTWLGILDRNGPASSIIDQFSIIIFSQSEWVESCLLSLRSEWLFHLF